MLIRAGSTPVTRTNRKEALRLFFVGVANPDWSSLPPREASVRVQTPVTRTNRKEALRLFFAGVANRFGQICRLAKRERPYLLLEVIWQ